MDSNAVAQRFGAKQFDPVERDPGVRTYSRKYVRLQQRQTSILQEMERNLEMCGIRITSFVSNISGKSVMNVIRALVEGENDSEVLAGYIHGRIVSKHKIKTIVESLRKRTCNCAASLPVRNITGRI